MLDYARWKYILVSAVLLIALIFALPNFFGDDYALQVARKDRTAMTTDELASVEKVLKDSGVTFNRIYLDGENVMVRFPDGDQQLRARDAVKDEKNGLTRNYVNAMSYASRAPGWVNWLGLRAMPLGLDLRGGLYLLYEVDVNGAVAQLLNTYEQDFRRALQHGEDSLHRHLDADRRHSDIPNGLRVLLPAGADRSKVRAAITKAQPDIACRDANIGTGAAVDCVLTLQQVRTRQDFAITANITTLRNRVNELGVSEPIVQRQGIDRIVVQLPGVQNSAEVKDLLGKVATLEYRLVDPRPIPPSGRAPVGAKILMHKEGYPVMVKRDIIVTGNQLVNAIAEHRSVRVRRST